MKGNDTSLPNPPTPPSFQQQKSDLETMTEAISLWLAQNNLFHYD